MKKFLIVFFVFLSFGCFIPSTGAAPLQGNDYQLIRIFQDYLNSTRTMQARFTQTASDGGRTHGTFYMSRPNRFRFDYDPPNHIAIISDGRSVVQYDKELKQADRVALSDTPADIFTRDNVDLLNDLSVTGFRQEGDLIYVTVTDPKASEKFEVTFVFSPGQMVLHQWSVKESGSNGATTIALSGMQRNLGLDAGLFQTRQ